MSGITRRSALRLFGSTAAIAGLGLAGCKKDEAQTAPTNTEGGVADPEPKSTVPTVDDFTVSDVDYDTDVENGIIHATFTISSSASVPCMVTADVVGSYTATDEYGDKQTEQTGLGFKIARGSNLDNSATNALALINAQDEAELELYINIPTRYDNEIGEDVVIDIEGIDVQVTEVEDATDNEYLLPDAYEIDGLAISTPEVGYGFQVTGTITNKTDHRWSSIEIGFLAIDADNNPYRFFWVEEGSAYSGYATTVSEAEYIKPDSSGELVYGEQDAAYRYNPEDNYSAVTLDSSQVFSIDKVASVEVQYARATFDDEDDSDE
ncbi:MULTISPECIES: hypothetical protein [Enorma]|nr:MULTISPECIES: hypothetical protein [Enorma]